MPDENPPQLVTSPPQRGAGLAGQLPLIIALLIIASLLAIWKPWNGTDTSNARTISVTGEAEVNAEPDEYMFTPQYTLKAASQQAALDAATAKTNEVVAKLKALGVADTKIKTDTSGYGSYYNDSQGTYYASLTITVDNKALAQKVQNYLLTTAPYGSVTPQADFSQTKRQQLTNTARDQATKEARAKADQTARNLGTKIGKVKSVSDNPDNNFFEPYQKDDLSLNAATNSTSAKSAPIQQGENKLTYNVSVVYYLR